ncbi:conserved protein of unknown function [Candidatus Hydrogenisulfobacillus filiaventi]|uniref:Diguanylate cyclase DosC n=1 Tax=Candidatus Hydrogenisulfobacillus filiaventi TaxID=2707344 RepID=A0A6F8ZCW7_9FIRM|nr:conserved protein of unknown function [Candidatus Hydrogenisulfobacillus filiaventi]
MTDIREEIAVVFQPVVDLWSGRVLGHEALARRRGREADGFLPLKRAAQRARQLPAVLEEAQRLALQAAPARPGGTLLFLNVNPALFTALLTEGLPAGLAWRDLVLEIPESEADFATWADRARQARKLGAAVALDDWGVGQADPLRLLRLEPEWIKIDRALVQGVGHDPAADRLLELLVRWTAPTAVRLVAEGVELPAQAETLLRLGIRYGQGFGLAAPEAGWRTYVPVPDPDGHRLAGLHHRPLAQAVAESLRDARLSRLESRQELLAGAMEPALDAFLARLTEPPFNAVVTDAATARELRTAVRAHLGNLLRGRLDISDVRAAERVATVHQAWGVNLAWYVSAHRRLTADLARQLRATGGEDLVPIVEDVMAWDLDQTVDATQQLLDIDPVTGVLTRGAFWARATHELGTARHEGRPFCLGVLALDGLEAVAAARGQRAADHLLGEVGRTLSGWLARGVLVGRLSGAGFGVVLPLPPARARRQLTGAVQALAATTPVLHVRWGLAALGNGHDLDSLYAQADTRALANGQARRTAES